jgi:hypothetical protein
MLDEHGPGATLAASGRLIDNAASLMAVWKQAWKRSWNRRHLQHRPDIRRTFAKTPEADVQHLPIVVFLF